MGITGLLPFLEKSSKRTNISQFSGGTVAIDSYCWLHKGVFSCAEKLSMGQPTDAYVTYCMKFIQMLLAHKIKPILVFDGRYLPAKAQTEAKRRENRQTNRRKAAELMRMGQRAEARNLLIRSIDVTHVMALELIKRCQQMNIDCIVAPYEADAQLAYLNVIGIADVIITEDSDLILFGCKKVFFKMDLNGNGLLVDQDKLYLAMGMQSEHFDMEKFRYMCILSGCDYLPSLPGIGLGKARKFITTNTDCDIHRALTRLGSYLNMKSLVVTKEYRDAFILAHITFKHQLVFCPLQRKQVRLNPPSADVTKEQLHYAGEEVNEDIALHLALGNCDPFTLEMLHNFDPDSRKNQGRKTNAWRKGAIPQHVSIWSKDYKLKENQQESPKKIMHWPNTVGQEMVLQTYQLRKRIFTKEKDDTECQALTEKEILGTYESTDTVEDENKPNIEDSIHSEKEVSPILIRRANPFSKQMTNNKTSPSLLSSGRSRIKSRNFARFRRTVIEEGVVTESKFFVKLNDEKDTDAALHSTMDCSSSNAIEIRLEKQEVLTERNDNTNDNINVKTLNVVNNMDTDLYHMDVDQERCNISLESNEQKEPNESILQQSSAHHSKYLDTSSNYDSGKSYLDIQMRDTMTVIDSSTNETYNSESSSSVYNMDPDFLVQKEDIDTLPNSLFKWTNPKLRRRTSSTVQPNKSKTSTNSRISLDTKLNTSSVQRSKQSCPVQKQQSLLSMYGFQKKSNLKL